VTEDDQNDVILEVEATLAELDLSQVHVGAMTAARVGRSETP
jgi:hypothetical protein